MTMKIEVKRTDKRHLGSNRFKYYVDIRPVEWHNHKLIIEKFFELRQWCWETWGPSREVDQYDSIEGAWTGDQNHAWSWINDDHRTRLYLHDKEEATHFALKWS
jgi:hypothetical protein